MGNVQDDKRTVIGPSSARPVSGELLSVDLRADEDVQWIWCHHGERGSVVIGYTLVPREPNDVEQSRGIGFFPLEETGNSSEQHTFV
jgi:hypothetical protein